MGSCINFPDEKFLKVYPCLNTICLDIKPAAKLLSALLFRCNLNEDTECKEELTNQQLAKRDKTSKVDDRTQSQLVKKDMCDEITEKTLHDTAIPTLYLLGFLDIDMSSTPATYTVYVDRVQLAINLHKCPVELEKLLIQIVRFPLENKKNFQLNKKNFQLELEKLLIGIRKTSNGKRGRKPTPEAGSEGIFLPPKNNKEYIRIEEDITAQSPIGELCSSSSSLSEHTQKDEPTRPSQLTPMMQQIQDKHTPPCKPARVQPVAQSGKPGRKAKGLSETETAVLDKWDSLADCEVDRNQRSVKDEVKYFAGLIEQGRITLDDIPRVRAKLLKQYQFRENGINFHQFHDNFSKAYTAPDSGSSASTQDKPTIDFDDPNFDPITIMDNNILWIQYQEHERMKADLAAKDTVLV